MRGLGGPMFRVLPILPLLGLVAAPAHLVTQQKPEGYRQVLPRGLHVSPAGRLEVPLDGADASEAGFERREGVWVERGTGDAFAPEEGAFSDEGIEPLLGFDTFWYTWSLNNPETRVAR